MNGRRAMPIIHSQSSIINRRGPSGSVLLVAVLLVALLATVVMGHLQVNTEETQLLHNHAQSTEALALAEAGLNDALARLRQDPDWKAPLVDQPLGRGSYTVVVDGATVTSTAVTAQGFVARVEAEITYTTGGSSSGVRIEKLRINR
ncbi:MAG: hypothetical protein MUC88_09715 [Planctomycetes bacterium]|nr:hypothetical protein [Planctomycetota bacterium]